MSRWADHQEGSDGSPLSVPRERAGRGGLSPAEARAARELIDRVRREVPAHLVQASLFGSKARGDARADSDIDLLLVFRALPPDREPHATQAEAIAAEVAARTAVPVTVWSVSLVDLELGQRTPMLVDALEDGIPLWSATRPLPALPFTAHDALRCVTALLERVQEGSEEFAAHRDAGAPELAARRVRDDLVRMCVAQHLLRGRTRPRRAEAAELLLRSGPHPAWLRRALRWAANSYGPDGRDEESPVPPPPHGLASVVRALEALRQQVVRGAEALAATLNGNGTSGGAPHMGREGTRLADFGIAGHPPRRPYSNAVNRP